MSVKRRIARVFWDKCSESKELSVVYLKNAF